MTCAEYMKNFYNDHAFKVQAYAHLLPPVLEMGSQMLAKCAGNMEAVNEILDLFRFVIDKYAAMTIAMPGGLTANQYLVNMLLSQWTAVTDEFFAKVAAGVQLPLLNETSIFIQRVLRILLSVVVVSAVVPNPLSESPG